MAKEIHVNELVGYTITTGAVLNDDYLIIILSNDARLEKDSEDNHSFVGIKKQNTWRIAESGYPISSQATITVPEPAIISISAVGIVRKSTPKGGNDEENVGVFSGNRIQGRTRLREVRAISGLAYTVGSRRSVYKRDTVDKWSCIDKDCYAPENFQVGFDSIHGFSPTEIYAAGENGEIWQYNGESWKQRETGTNAWLNKIVCAENGFVYAVGEKGTILKGRNDKWALIEEVSSGHEFWSIESYKGRLFLTADTISLYELLPNGELKLVNFGDCPPPTTAYHLTTGGGCLYCFGFKDIRKFDGFVWTEVLTLY